MPKFSVTRWYAVKVDDATWRNIPDEYKAGFVDACTRMIDLGDCKALYLYGSGVDAYWGDANEGEGEGSIGPFEDWWAEEVDSNFD